MLAVKKLYILAKVHKKQLISALLAGLFLCLPQEAASQEERSFPERLLNYDVIIDVGHGGIDGGTFYGAVLEKDLNLSIGIKLYHELKNLGYQVGITRVHDYALSDDYTSDKIKSRHKRDLTQRWLIAQGLRPKLFISIHVNYSSSKEPRGPMIIYQKKGESYLFATLLQRRLNQFTNQKQTSISSSKYFLLKTIKSPALIAEVGYISNPQERQLLQDDHYQKQLAQTITQAIEDYFTLYPTFY